MTTNTIRTLTAQDLLAGSKLIHEIAIPPAVLTPGAIYNEAEPMVVRMRPLTVGMLALISRAAREDVSLVPLLLIKESLVEPALSLDQVRQLHVGLVHFLVSHVNLISGLTADGESPADQPETPTTQAHLLLARHFGWTPEQVSQLTPGQVAIYLAGVERLLQYEEARR
jgi:hypothetical protein